MEFANSIRTEFSLVDTRKESEISKLFEKYREMITPVYQEWGLSNTSYNHLLANKIESDISAFSTQISNANAIIRNVANGNMNVTV